MNKKTRNVLIFPLGTEIGLEIAQSLQFAKEVKIFGAGQGRHCHGEFLDVPYHSLPSVYETNWLDALIALCQQLCIDYIFPCYDDVLVALAREQEKIPAIVITSPRDTCILTRSKAATYSALKHVLRVPKTYSTITECDTFPLFVKPDIGQGSFGAQFINNFEELAWTVGKNQGLIICEYVPGEEYTVDCFSDREKGLLFAGARRRTRIRNGISVNTVSEKIDGVFSMADLISTKLRMRGAWFFQVKRAEDNDLVLLEVAPRIAGAMATHRVMGINFPLLSIFEHERVPIRILVNQSAVELDRALSNRYRHNIVFSTLYVDLDDTLIMNGKVNLAVVALVFKCINERKPVKLITRHRENLQKTLNGFRIFSLFDAIIHLEYGEPKSSCIPETDAVLIDDSFSERYEVSTVLGIPTFDCSMVEALLGGLPAS